MADHALLVEGLTKSFAAGPRAEVLAVDDVSFAVPSGGALAIVGESGSGKTTVARCLTGLEEPTAGTIEVCGERRSPRRLRLVDRRRWAKRIQLVFQDPYSSLDPRQVVGAALAEALTVHGAGPGRGQRIAVEQLLERVGLSAGVAEAYPRVLSGGQRQRVAIARALAAEPEVVIFDESVAALDVSVQAQVLNLVSDLRESSGLTTVFISHDLAVVRQISDSVIVMRHGAVVERGATASVLAAPEHPYTRLLIDSIPRPGWQPGRALRAVAAAASAASSA